MRAWLESLLCVIYPARCRCCEEPLGLSSVPYLCDDCWQRIRLIEPPLCSQCGSSLPKHLPHGILCSDCQRYPPPFLCRSLAIYENALREAIHLFKYDGKRIFAHYFSEIILAQAAILHELGTYDGVIPVPLHKKRYRQRGFNQSEILAQSVATVLNAPVRDAVLKRIRNTAPQSSLRNASERQRNLRNAFHVIDPACIQGQRLLLVDDIYTTGATVREAAKTLTQMGAAEVNVLTLSRA